MIAVNENMNLVGEFDLKKETVEKIVGNSGNGQDKLGVEEYSRPRKIIRVRNSLIILYSHYLLEFNTHTCTVTNTLPLPFSTLDLAVQHHLKTQSTTLIMTG